MVSDMFEEFDRIVGNPMHCDKACKNLSRLRRLP